MLLVQALYHYPFNDRIQQGSGMRLQSHWSSHHSKLKPTIMQLHGAVHRNPNANSKSVSQLPQRECKIGPCPQCRRFSGSHNVSLKPTTMELHGHRIWFKTFRVFLHQGQIIVSIVVTNCGVWRNGSTYFSHVCVIGHRKKTTTLIYSYVISSGNFFAKKLYSDKHRKSYSSLLITHM